MPSIRRSLLGYLLLLLALALGAVGVFVDRFANGALRQREASEVDRIEQTFKLRQHEAKTKFDADLLAESKALAREVHSHTRPLVGQNPDQRFRPGGPPPKMGDPTPPKSDQPPPPKIDPPPTLKASEDEARQFRLRVTMLEFAPVPGFLPALAPTAAVEPIIRNDWRRHYPYPTWVEFEGPRALARIQEALRKAFAEEHAPHQYQFTLVAAPPAGRGTRDVFTVRSEKLSDDLPTDAALLDPTAEIEPKIDDTDIPGLGPCRRVVTGTLPSGRPLTFWIFLPSPPPPAQVPRYPVYPPLRGPDLVLRVIVHVARPYSELDTRLVAERQERDDQIASVREETRGARAQLRARLILIGSGTFAALVLGGWFIVARGLAPLRILSDAVSRVSEKDFRLPVVPAQLGHELAPIHARLTQTLTLLQRAFAREKQAVADISHELRTPIAALLATIDVALRKPRTPDQYRSTLEECRLISKQLGQLVERIMTLASLDAGNDHTASARTDAIELAGGCAAVIRPLAAANNITVTTHFADELVLETDAAKLREVLMNLLHNAVEYNKPGGTIDLTARPDGASAVFEVRDTGIGMAADVQDKIFERFYRADSSRQATGVHAGLGLAIVREYVARLGGSITVESQPGVGTTFRVALPLTAPVPADAPSPPSPSQSERTKPRDTVAASS
jgi:signal transduction histidine kinase